jgi:hypothetical protein
MELTMSDTIPARHFTRELFDVLTETFEQVKGIYLDRGTSLFETLATISADEASRPISSRCATIAAQVEHVRFYLDVLANAITSKQPVRVDWGEIWRTVHAVTPDEWQASQTRLRESYQRVVTLFNSITTWDGEEEISGSLAIVVHTAYHLGEIRQALCVIKENKTAT